MIRQHARNQLEHEITQTAVNGPCACERKRCPATPQTKLGRTRFSTRWSDHQQQCVILAASDFRCGVCQKVHQVGGSMTIPYEVIHQERRGTR